MPNHRLERRGVTVKKLLPVIIVFVVAWIFSTRHRTQMPLATPPELPAAAPAAASGDSGRDATAGAPSSTQTDRKCDGRVYCSQMTSCDEAKYFLAHCPGVKMDGDRDGIPCERQFCGD